MECGCVLVKERYLCGCMAYSSLRSNKCGARRAEDNGGLFVLGHQLLYMLEMNTVRYHIVAYKASGTTT